MLYRVLPTLAALLTISVVTTSAQNRPWFCQSYDCPGFSSRDEGGYEVRNYEATMWVATSVNASTINLPRSERSPMFRRLFNYISGENANNQKIDMTVPVLTKIETLGNKYRFTMMFYLSIANPPAPNDRASVFLVPRPAGPVFVKSFPGRFWPSSGTYRTELQDMKNSIANGALYNDNVYYKAGYNAPFEYLKRKQFEVWLDQV